MLCNLIERSRGLGIKPGLDRIRDCLAFLGNPQKQFKSVLIAGTNGKGSVAFYLSNLACKFTGYKIGRYISPHLLSWNERFVINEHFVTEELLEEFSVIILKKIEEFENLTNEKLTIFEVYTVIAFCLFAKEKVDIAFLEVGMGGRLDAVNIVDSSDILCSIITSISFDHTEYLGNTLEKIAYEKAGIIKENNFLITGAYDSALDVILNRAHELNSSTIVINDNLLYPDKNRKIALQAWEIISSKINFQSLEINKAEFLKGLQFPGRYQFFKEHNILLDGAHNVQAGIELRKLIDRDFKNKKIVFIVGMLDKDYKGFLKSLIPENSLVICTEPESPRATKKELLSEYAMEQGLRVTTANNLKEAIGEAKNNNHDLILITGSLYLVGEGMRIVME